LTREAHSVWPRPAYFPYQTTWRRSLVKPSSVHWQR